MKQEALNLFERRDKTNSKLNILFLIILIWIFLILTYHLLPSSLLRLINRSSGMQIWKPENPPLLCAAIDLGG